MTFTTDSVRLEMHLMTLYKVGSYGIHPLQSCVPQRHRVLAMPFAVETESCPSGWPALEASP